MKFLQIVNSEIRYQLKSVVFWIFLIVTVVFYSSQFLGDSTNLPLKPVPPGEVTSPFGPNYGVTNNLTQSEEMAAMKERLMMDYQSDSYLKMGLINKNVRFSPAEKEAAAEFLQKLQSSHLQYEEYLDAADQFDKLLGGNTHYGKKYRAFLNRLMTYEEALAEYDVKVQTEGLTNAYGRLFADYLGITAGLFPIFIAAFLLRRDRRTHMDELIRAKNVRALTYILAKYFAVVLLLSAVYILIAIHPTWKFYQICSANDWIFNPFGFLRYTIAWVVPTMLFTVALGMTVAEITGNGLFALVLQVLLWFSSIGSLEGDYSLSKYVIRFNTSGNYDLLLKSAQDLWCNRLFYLGLSLLLVLICASVWNRQGQRGRKRFYVFHRRRHAEI